MPCSMLENCVPTVPTRMPMVSAAKRAEPPPSLTLQMSVVSECHDAITQRELPMRGSGVVSSRPKLVPWTIRIEPAVPGTSVVQLNSLRRAGSLCLWATATGPARPGQPYWVRTATGSWVTTTGGPSMSMSMCT